MIAHCYVFDYSVCKIYHIEIPYVNCTNDVIETYLYGHYGFNLDKIHFMLSNEELKIEKLK